MGQILFVLEGTGAEPQILESLWTKFLKKEDFIGGLPTVTYLFGTHIYTLYKKLKEEPGLDLIGVLKEHDPQNVLADADNETFEQIFLIFDYDGHVNMPADADNPGNHLDGDNIIEVLLSFFDNETDNGKLYISYPMVEAIKHLDRTPRSIEELVVAKCKGPHCPNMECGDRSNCPPVRKEYKGLINNLHPHRQNVANIESDEWSEIFLHHIHVIALLQKLNGPEELRYVDSEEIFQTQKSQFISLPCPKVAVVSAFPMLFLDVALGKLLERIGIERVE